MSTDTPSPLLKKLGIKPGYSLVWIDVPPEYENWLGPLPPNVVFLNPPAEHLADVVHAFFRNATSFNEQLPTLKRYLKKDGMLWISWPKGGSKIPTDLKRDYIREQGIAAGLVDVKVASVSQDWSGLKFVYRLEDR